MPRNKFASRPLAERFWEKVRKAEGCWEWTAFRMRNGYGTIGYETKPGRKWFAHRVSWLLHYGPIPDGMFVCHHCDNPGCVRPDHLFLGTPADNMADKKRKGRDYAPGSPGERNPKAKLTEAMVRRIHALASGGMTQVQVGAIMGVTQTTVGCIMLGHTWKHLGLSPVRKLHRKDTPAASNA